jgi:ribosomal protein L7/L12
VSNTDDVIAKLERLQGLRDSGVLTQAELESQKAALLAGASTCAECGAQLQVNANGACIWCGTPAPRGAPAAVVSEDALADSIVAAHPDNLISAIKELRQQTGLGLKEAKERIEAAQCRAAGMGR